MIDKKELELFADLRATSSRAEIIGFDFKGKKYWLKKARKGGANIFHRIAYKCTKIALLAPPLIKTKQESLVHEVEKLKRLYSLGLNVPKVVFLKNDYFILADGGISVLNTLREASEDEKKLCLEKSVKLLALLHQKGEFHGGAQVKNFTYKDGTVYAIDFEETFDEKVPLEELFFRDMFLFLFSLSKHRIDVNYEEIIAIYDKEIKTDASMLLRFKEFADKFKGVTRLVNTPLFQKILDKDTKSIARMFDVFVKI